MSQIYHRVALFNIEEIPKINEDSRSESKEDDNSVDFASEVASEANTRRNEPSPPLGRKLTVNSSKRAIVE